MRRSTLFWGAMLIFGGTLLLLDNLGIIRVNVWSIIGPVFLIALGISLLGRSLFRRPVSVERANVPLEGARRARLTLDHGAGRLEIRSGAPASDLVEGSFGGGVEVHSRMEGDLLAVRLSARAFNFPFDFDTESLHWSLALNNHVPLSIELNGGANEVILDLTDLLVTGMHLKSGASSTQIRLPRQAGQTEVSLETGAASVEVWVPENVAARIHSESGLSSIDIDQGRFPRVGGGYESPHYTTAENRVDIRIQTGVGSITVR